MKTEILNYLKEDARFRDRVNKNKGIANLIMKKYGVSISPDKRDDFIGDILSADRCWRKALEEYPELRGKDYDDKQILEQQTKISLGYEPTIKLKI